MSNISTPPRANRTHFFDSLGIRLVVMLVLPLLVVSTATAWYTLHTASTAWEEVIASCGLRMGDNILAATHLGMLANHKEDVQFTVERLAEAPGVTAIRIYDKEGRIAFSGDPDEVGKTVTLESEACESCHPSPDIERPARFTRVRRIADGTRQLDINAAVPSGPECSNAACHAHPDPSATLGSVDIHLSLAQTDRSLSRIRAVVVAGALALVVLLVLGTTLLVGRMVQVPVRKLIAGTRQVAGGDLEYRVGGHHSGELGVLAQAFDRMTGQLKEARAENEEWSHTLEEKVERKTEELERTREQLIHVEKMASLGKLAATVAHEINNPLSGILTYAKLSTRVLSEEREALLRDLGEKDTEGLFRYLDLIERESTRCGQIVQNLLLFSRESAASMSEHDLHDIVQRSIMLVSHHLEVSNVDLERERCPEGTTLICDANLIQQALVALLMNAVEAMEEGGAITVECSLDGDEVQIAIGDTGPGIPDEVLPRIFEPFYSTKDDKKGVGLGLAVVYGIVRRHEGIVAVDTNRSGTTFRIRLPRQPSGETQE